MALVRTHTAQLMVEKIRGMILVSSVEHVL